MSDRKPPAGVEGCAATSLSPHLRGAGGGSLLLLDRGLVLLVRRLGFLLARVLFVALHVVAALLRDVVLRVGLGFVDLALAARRGVGLVVELGLGDVLLALRFLLAVVLRVAGHGVALGRIVLVLRLDLVLFRVLHLAVGAGRGRRGLGKRAAGKGERRGDTEQLNAFHVDSFSFMACAAGRRPAIRGT